MSKQSKLAAWQSPAPTIIEPVKSSIKPEPKVTKITEALEVVEPIVEPTIELKPVVEKTPVNEKPVVEQVEETPKPEIKKLKKAIVE